MAKNIILKNACHEIYLQFNSIISAGIFQLPVITIVLHRPHCGGNNADHFAVSDFYSRERITIERLLLILQL